MARVDYWNHNVHYQPVILRAVPGVHYRRHLLWRYSLLWSNRAANATSRP